jgi:hypothetical protein
MNPYRRRAGGRDHQREVKWSTGEYSYCTCNIISVPGNTTVKYPVVSNEETASKE